MCATVIGVGVGILSGVGGGGAVLLFVGRDRDTGDRSVFSTGLVALGDFSLHHCTIVLLCCCLNSPVIVYDNVAGKKTFHFKCSDSLPVY